MAFSHGSNDAQKSMGIICLLLITAGVSTSFVASLTPWVVYSCYGAIAWGTYLGGWRIVKTMGSKITKLNAVSGSCASMGGAISLGLATLGGIPVSTTHTITGAIVGVGTAQDVRAVRWASPNLVVPGF
jgi:PiT family inorganic phosphate transporter